MTSSGSLYAIAGELLVKATTILDGLPAKAPKHQFVCHGPPAYDCCDMLTVHAGTIQYADFSRGGAGSPRPDIKVPVVPIVPLTVTALRCMSAWPRGGAQIHLPVSTKISADAAIVSADGWSLFCGFRKAHRDGTLLAGFPCRVFEVDGALPIAPEGGCLGWSITLHAQLDGFDPAGA